MHPFRPTPFLPLAFLLFFLFAHTLHAQTFQLSSGAIRQEVDLPAGPARFTLCDLVPGQTYTVVLNGLAGNVQADWQATDGRQQRVKSPVFRFQAVSTCQEIACTAGNRTPVKAQLSVSAGAPAAARGKAAQGLQLSNVPDPATLIAEYLFGNTCHEISNVKFKGYHNAIGTFTGGQTSIAMPEGILLSTGDIYIWQGPNTMSNASAGFGAFNQSDIDLATVTQGAQFDQAIIEFDVVPSVPSLSMQFVFGSEEYCEYVGSNYNDAFGLFVSGPGINGVQNIARIPGSNMPVSTNTVNFNINPDYYVNNNDFEYQCAGLPLAAPGECELDGWTKAINASINVIPCSTYHVKIAISDINDGIWDSAVFLRSLSSIPTAQVKAAPVYPNNQNLAFEGCQNGQIRIRRAGNNTALPVPVSFTVSGTATPGIDYEPLVSPVLIPAGQTEIFLPVNILADQLPEGNETIVLDIDNACACAQDLVFTIGELSPVSVDNPDVKACTSTLLTPSVSGGLPPYTYAWSNGSQQQEILVFHSPGIQTYTVTVTDACGNTQSDAASVLLYSNAIPPQTIQFCAGDSVVVNGQVFTETTAFTYQAAGQNGQCDTLITILVQEVTLITRTIPVSLCPGEPYTLNGNTYFAPATITQLITGSNGACDTLKTYQLTVAPAVPRSETLSFCPGASVTIGGTVYSTPGTVIDTIPATGPGCDTIVTYTLIALPPTQTTQTYALCPGEVFTFNGQPYTAPAILTETRPGQNGQCDTVLTRLLVLKTPAPSTVAISCPAPVTVFYEAGEPAPAVHFALPAATSNCPCPGTDLVQSSGLPPGSAFPAGNTLNCFVAKDACGNTDSCCFTVSVKENPPCDVKTSGCIKWETLSVNEDGEGRTTYKIRVTNNCANPLLSADFQLPKGILAEAPAHNSVYTSPAGRNYLVTNPNASPFYSIRFSALQGGISGGASDIFEYTLPPQAEMIYILAFVRVSPASYYSAHLSTANCQNFTQTADRSAETTTVQLFPNPADAVVFIDLPGQTDTPVPVRILDSKGTTVLSTRMAAGAGPQALVLPENLADGVYLLEAQLPDGRPALQQFVVLRR